MLSAVFARSYMASRRFSSSRSSECLIGLMMYEAHSRSAARNCSISVMVDTHDRSPDRFGDLRDDGVSDGVNSVNPIGRPIIHSSKLAQRILPRSVPRNGLLLPPHSSKRPTVWFLPPFTPLGVGNNPDPVPVMGRANVGRRYAIPLRIVPERGQATEDDVEPAREDGFDVFHDNELGSKLANKSKVFEPQSASFSGEPGAKAGEADVLAGESSADGVHGNSICSQAVGREGAHVVVDRDAGPSLVEDSTAVGGDFAERDGSHSGALKAEAESSNS